MIQITWHGISCFQIKSTPATHEVSLVIDPYENDGTLRFPRTLEADFLLSSSNAANHHNLEAVGGKPFIVESPGEYEVKGVFAYGINAPRKNEPKERHTIYRIETENVSLAHLGSLDRELTDEEVEQLRNIDILMIPVGGGPVLAPRQAVETI